MLYRFFDFPLLSFQLQGHKANFVRYAGPADIRNDLEFMAHPVNYGLFDQTLRKGEVEFPIEFFVGPCPAGN